MTRIYGLRYDAGVPLDLVRDIGVLEEYVHEYDFKVVYSDQILDHMSGDLNSHTQHHVRQALAPLRGLARRREITCPYTAHPNKTRGGSARDRVGGSGQFVDVPRSALLVGYHPDRDGIRAVARAKGNVGAIPDALTFEITSRFVVNPKSGERIEIGAVANVEPDPELLLEGISTTRTKNEEAKLDVITRVMSEAGADGEKHSRREAGLACQAAGVSLATFERHFPTLDFINRERDGKKVVWWLI